MTQIHLKNPHGRANSRILGGAKYQAVRPEVTSPGAVRRWTITRMVSASVVITVRKHYLQRRTVGITKSEYTCRHHAIYIKNKWTLAKVYSNMLAWLFHSHRRKELPFNLAEGGPWEESVRDAQMANRNWQTGTNLGGHRSW